MHGAAETVNLLSKNFEAATGTAGKESFIRTIARELLEFSMNDRFKKSGGRSFLLDFLPLIWDGHDYLRPEDTPRSHI